ncbi:hypothetical protein [Bifidobacterium parmae]|uniref:Colicin transporter n=1 Tax=Bifidobacterium parmae TaxID=361854 RepID=A0A2N5IW74_9BIFI|nr:hypothetical protein [Bifidobacterium parmae]PLS26213.1 hypothetical protein Uis4E_1788 [Bifidobacterium parmae]
MSEIKHDVSGLPPVPLPDGTQSDTIGATGRRRPKWLLPLAGAGLAVLLVAGGLGGYTVWSNHELAVAKTACAEASDRVRVAANRYNTLLDGEAAGLAKVKTSQVKDAKTIGTLVDRINEKTPDYEGCVADRKPDLDAAAAKLDKQADWYGKHTKSLKTAVKAVRDSKLAKTIDTANTLLKDSDGKVADGKTRDELAKAIRAKDETAIATASRKVTDSIDAKRKADEDARAKAEAEAQAAAQAAAAQQAAQASQSYSGGGYSYTGGGYANSGYSGGYSGGYSSSGGSTGGYTGGGTSSGGNTGSSATIAPPISGGHGCSSNCGTDDGWYHH